MIKVNERTRRSVLFLAVQLLASFTVYGPFCPANSTGAKGADETESRIRGGGCPTRSRRLGWGTIGTIRIRSMLS